MKKQIILTVLCAIFSLQFVVAQFGQNKVQFKEMTWYYIQTSHFDIYFNQEGSKVAEFASRASEAALGSIEKHINYRIQNRITLILYNSQNDFQETNVTDEYLSEGIGGFTELFKNRVVLPFTGNYKMFRHVIHHELVHAVLNDMFYGGSIQNIISNNISIRLPLWFNEGLAEYLSLGWDTNTDMFIRDAATSEYLPDIQDLDGYFAYRGGQAVFHYIAQKYGEEKIGELVNKIKGKANFENGLKSAIGLDLEELNERWKKDIKRIFWPDMALYKDPDEFSKRLTDHRKDGGFYNTSPAISPQGDKIAFISNRDFYFDIYIMDANDGKKVERIIKGNRSADFEELNILTPGLSWSPDGKKIAVAAKRNGADVIYVYDVAEDDISILPLRFSAIGTVNWAPDNNTLVFAGQTSSQSDIFIYDIEKDKLRNITNDIFSDSDPSFSPDGKTIFFASDRGEFVDSASVPENFVLFDHNYFQNDLYSVQVESKQITRLTNTPHCDEASPIVSADGKEVIFVSDKNGINNIYRKKIYLEAGDPAASIAAIPAVPITNSLNGLYQPTISKDGKKLAFASMYQSAYNIFLMNNPHDISLDKDSLPLTKYMESILTEAKPAVKNDSASQAKVDSTYEQTTKEQTFSTGVFLDSSSTKKDYSNFIFGKSDYRSFDSTEKKEEELFNPKANLDAEGNYKVNRYKVTFTPDIIYANAGFSSLYGLLGTTVISFSDVLGNHRLVGQTSLQIDLKNSDYGLAYFYLPNKLDIGFEGFHTARFVYLQRGSEVNLFRFRNYGGSLSLSYPFNRYYRLDGGLSLLNVSSENLDNPYDAPRRATYLLPTISFIHDNTMFGYTAPIDGTRYRFDLYGNPILHAKEYGFYSVLGDYRNYTKFWTDYAFAFRLSGGFSNGKSPQRFFLGGIENWINRKFATGEVPLDSPSDFAFLTAALPMRGYNYAQQIGTKYALFNTEFRFPFIRYLVTGALPIMFRNILGAAFFDAGSAWNNTHGLQLFTHDAEDKTISKDLLMGTGFGMRFYFLYFLLRIDCAWAYNAQHFTTPIWYFSLGGDF